MNNYFKASLTLMYIGHFILMTSFASVLGIILCKVWYPVTVISIIVSIIRFPHWINVYKTWLLKARTSCQAIE